MRILVISNLYPPGFQGGYELGCAHVTQELAEAGHEVRVLTSGEPAGERHVNRALSLFPVFDPAAVRRAMPAERRELEARARLFVNDNDLALAHELADFQPDVAYLWNLLGVGGLSMVGRLELEGVPWVWHLMDAVPLHLCMLADAVAPQLRDALAEASLGQFLGCSMHVLGEIAAGGVQLPGRVEVVPNWVSGSLPPARTRFFRAGLRRLRAVSAVGVLVEHKGIDILIEVAARLEQTHPGALELDLFGREDDDRFRRLAADLNVAETIRFGGLLPQDDLLRRLRTYDMFVAPTAWRAPFAFAPLEAAAAGCVPLVTDTSGLAEWMVGGVHCLKAARTPEAFAAVLAAVLRGEIDLEPIARRGQSVVREMFYLPALMPWIESALEEAATRGERQGTNWLFEAAVSGADRLLGEPSLG